MKNPLVVVLFAFVLVTFFACGGKDETPSQSISLKVAAVDATSVQIGVKLAHAGWFNLTLEDQDDPIYSTWISSDDSIVAFIEMKPGTHYLAHGMTFDQNGEPTSDDWLTFSTMPDGG